jgi:hypothetical protein
MRNIKIINYFAETIATQSTGKLKYYEEFSFIIDKIYSPYF